MYVFGGASAGAINARPSIGLSMPRLDLRLSLRPDCCPWSSVPVPVSTMTKRLLFAPPTDGTLGRFLTESDNFLDFLLKTFGLGLASASELSGEYSEGEEAVDICLGRVARLLVAIAEVSGSGGVWD